MKMSPTQTCTAGQARVRLARVEADAHQNRAARVDQRPVHRRQVLHHALREEVVESCGASAASGPRTWDRGSEKTAPMLKQNVSTNANIASCQSSVPQRVHANSIPILLREREREGGGGRERVKR
jgi:hypothetical protein